MDTREMSVLHWLPARLVTREVGHPRVSMSDGGIYIGFPYCPSKENQCKIKVFLATRFEHQFFSMKNES